MKPEIAYIHGVNTPASFDCKMQVESVLAVHGLDVDCCVVRWDSHGAIEDMAKFTLNDAWRTEQVNVVADTLVEYDDPGRPVMTPKVLVAHSLGTVLVAAALRRMPGMALKTIFLGSPWHNAFARTGFEALGIRGPLAITPWSFYNNDDEICGGSYAREISWAHNTRIAYAGDSAPFVEHDPAWYLRHQLVGAKVKEFLWGPST